MDQKKGTEILLCERRSKIYRYIFCPFITQEDATGEERREDRRERNVTKKKRRMKSRAGECETGGY